MEYTEVERVLVYMMENVLHCHEQIIKETLVRIRRSRVMEKASVFLEYRNGCEQNMWREMWTVNTILGRSQRIEEQIIRN